MKASGKMSRGLLKLRVRAFAFFAITRAAAIYLLMQALISGSLSALFSGALKSACAARMHREISRFEYAKPREVCYGQI